VVSSAPPSTTVSTSGSKYCRRRREATADVCTEISLGLATTVFPAASAPMMGSMRRCSGKFHGAITRTTPSGSYVV
jgi:hypothetical protein